MLKPIVTLALLCGILAAQHARAVWEYVHTSFSGTYAVYGGYLDEPRSPTPGDTKIAFNLTGQSAKAMFDGMGAMRDENCANRGVRMRRKDMLLCWDRAKDGYRCTFAFDLSTGLSVGGANGAVICQGSSTEGSPFGY